MAIHTTTKLQIRHGIVIVYNETDYTHFRTSQQNLLLKQNFKNMKTYSGTMTEGTKKRIRKTIDLLMQLSPEKKKYNPVTGRVIKHQLSFITLTVSNDEKMLSAKDGYNLLLAPFIRYMRDKKELKTYIWKAELQKRGQIHYHITTPEIIDYKTIKEYWNHLQDKAGLLEKFKAKYKHNQPNSTDIHQVRKINNIQAYLSKEFCKTVQNETPTTGKLWDCSMNLKGAKFFSVEMKSQHEKNIWNAYRFNHLEELKLEQCSVLKMKKMKSYSLLTPVEKKVYKEFIQSLER